MPQDALDEVLGSMDAERATRLRRLRRRATADRTDGGVAA
jgi:hypothetical protein